MPDELWEWVVFLPVASFLLVVVVCLFFWLLANAIFKIMGE